MKTKDWEKEFDKLSQTKMTTKEFIRNLLSQQKREIVGEMEKEIKLQGMWFDGCDTDYGRGWNDCLEQLNQQFTQPLTN